ncbi:MAG: NAD(P)-dependent dehydrogenase (short-subunit alcohol dehydrogenase family) [Neolewinella sp.]|jgi:NAD(P)-dependent dehydrogenase (short-subunit alcohol dehydrogenase family)
MNVSDFGQCRQQVVLVTGASSGIGREIAEHLASAGFTVFGTSRTQQDDFGNSENPVRMLPLDVTDETSVRGCLHIIEQATSGLTVLVNNAGNGVAGAIEDSSDEEVRWQMETNFFGVMNVTRNALALMRSRGYGKLITVSSIAAHVGLPFQGAYSASKSALEAINQSLRYELEGSGVQSTVICPGDFRTGFTASRKIVRNANSDYYGAQFRKTLGIYERDEKNGASPKLIGLLAIKLVTRSRLAPRYFVGRADQKMAVFIKRWLPALWFERLARLTFGISKTSNQHVH